jgi:hypothetical protein
MQTQQKTSHRTFEYGVGALVILAISIGLAIIVYAGGIQPFTLSDIPSWLLGPLGICTFIFGPLGIYTVIYSAVARKESTYYLVWGTIILAIAVVSGFYNTAISPFLVIGVLIILIAIIGLIAYMRSRK